MALSTMYKHSNLILDFFFDISGEHIHFPDTPDEKKQIAANFENVYSNLYNY